MRDILLQTAKFFCAFFVQPTRVVCSPGDFPFTLAEQEWERNGHFTDIPLDKQRKRVMGQFWRI